MIDLEGTGLSLTSSSSSNAVIVAGGDKECGMKNVRRSELSRIFESFEYSNNYIRILLFVFVFGPIATVE